MGYKEFTGDLDAPDAATAAPRYREFEGDLDKPDTPGKALAPAAASGAPRATADLSSLVTTGPAPSATDNAVRDTPTPAAQRTVDQAMINPAFVDKLREDFRSLPPEQRLQKLRSLAGSATVQNRAAGVLLAQVERENQRTPDTADDERLAAQLLKAPQVPAKSGTAKASPDPVRFPDVQPSYADTMDQVAPADIAARRGLAQGLGQERQTQKVDTWAQDARAKAAAKAEAARKAALPRTWGEVASDSALDVASGIVQGADAASGLVNMGTYGGLRKMQRALGLNPNAGAEVAQELGTHQSEKMQGSQAAFEAAEGPVEAAQALWDHPLSIASGVMQSGATMALPFGAARGMVGTIVAAEVKRALAKGASEAAAKAAGEKALESTASAVKIAWAAHAGEGLESAGSIAQQALKEDPNDPAQMYWGVPSAFATAAIGRLAGKVPGFGDAEAALFSGNKRLGATGNYGVRVGKAFVQEGLLQETPQSAEEQAFTNLATGKPIDEDVGKQTVQGGIVGGFMGATHAGAHPLFHGSEHPAPAPAPAAEEIARSKGFLNNSPPDAAKAYDTARANGFNVDPPLTSDTADTQRKKTLAIFDSLAANVGIPKAAVDRAKTAVDGMAAPDVGGFLRKIIGAYEARGLTGRAVDPHVIDTLDAGPVEPPTDETKPQAKAPTGAADPEPDYSGLAEPAEPQKPQPTDLMTADEQPYGTKAGAQARSTREGGGDVVAVPGGWVVRPQPTTLDERTAAAAQPAGTRGTTAADVLPAASTERPEADDAQPADSTPAAADVAARTPVPPGAEPGRGDGAVAILADDAGRGIPAAADAHTPGSGAALPVRGDGARADAVGSQAPATRVIAQAGVTPKTASPIELRPNPDGTSTPWHEGYALNDFDSGEPIVIPAGTSNRAAINLIKPSFGKSTKVFKVEADAQSSGAPSAQAAPAVAPEGALKTMWKVRTALGGSASDGSPVLQTSETDRPRPPDSLPKGGDGEAAADDHAARWTRMVEMDRREVSTRAGLSATSTAFKRPWAKIAKPIQDKLRAAMEPAALESGTSPVSREPTALETRIRADVGKAGGKIIGQNIDGKDVKEDSRGVRTVGGQTEAVRMVPTRGPNGSVVMAIGKIEHKGEYLTAAEHAAANAAAGAPAAPAPSKAPGKVMTVRQAKVRAHPSMVRGSMALAQISKRLGGISPALLPDLSQKRPFVRVNKKTGKRTPYVAWDNPGIPGYGVLFRDGGSGDMSEIARVLEEEGFITHGTVEHDPHEATRRADAIIKAELTVGGSTLRIGDADSVERQMQARREAEMDDASRGPQAPQEEADPWDSVPLAPGDLELVGYTALSDRERELTEAALQAAEELGIDTDTLKENAARLVGDDATENAYHAALRSATWASVKKARRENAERDARGEGAGAASGSEDSGAAPPSGGREPADGPAGRPDGAAADKEVATRAAPKLVGAQGLVQRQENARQSFIDSVVEQFGLSPEEAARALEKLIKVKVVKLDPLSGQFKLKDGRFWDAEPMRRAAGMEDEAPAADKPGEPLLAAQSEADLKTKADREAEAQAAEKKKRDIEQARLKKAEQGRDEAHRADQTVDDFQLGQSAEAQLSGTSDMFDSLMAERPEAPPASPSDAMFDDLMAERTPAALPTTTAVQDAASAAAKTAKAVSDAIDGLGKLFGGGPGTLGSGPVFNEETYEKAKPLFISALGNLKEAAADLRSAMAKVIDAMMAKFGRAAVIEAKPYIVRFIDDVRDGKVRLEQPAPPPPATASAAHDIVEHVTAKGKTIRGVIRTDLTREQAHAIDEYTFKKGDGYFIRDKHLAALEAAHPADAPAAPAPITTAPAANFTDHLYEKIKAGDMPTGNLALKRLVHDFDNAPPTPARMKQAQEALEAAIVRTARDVVARKQGTQATFDALVRLYDSQPNLNVRTSTSIENQAYSTPAPLAYLASKLAGITRSSVVAEPTGGNGMLLIAADPARAFVNEINQDRATSLRAQGFEVTTQDAAVAPLITPRSADVVITNPPFGGLGKKVKVDGYALGQIDHLIAAHALEGMKDDGRATLIIGANKVTGQQSNADLIFFNWLYSHYNVTSHFEVDGDLYQRQGAAGPVRVITINGRQASNGIAPAPATIQRASTWSDVYAQFEQALGAERRAVVPGGAVPGRPGDTGPVPAPAGDQAARPDRSRPAGGPPVPGNVLGERPRTVGDRGAQPAEPVGGSLGTQRPAIEPAAVPVVGEPGGERTQQPAGNARTVGLTEAENQFQAKYVPRSSNQDKGVLIPVNMAGPTQDALNRLEDEVGNIDEYARTELGYETVEDLHDALMGLQVDSVASAIYQIKAGKGVIIADQTGIGKGRQAAAIIRWTIKTGRVPVFVTLKPSLFTDMHGDLADIGSPDVAPFILNVDASIKGEGDEKLFANKASGHRRVLDGIVEDGAPPAGRNALFMTYSQINTANRQRDVVMALAPRAVFILDESHNAGGASNTGEFIREALGLAQGVTYLSATYAKRPDNMPVYFKTDIGDAMADDNTLMAAMEAGGLPLQTVVANNLVSAGQMFRRERSYDGVSIETRADTAHRIEHEKLSDTTTSALRAIVEADAHFHTNYVKELQKELEKQGERLHDIAGNQAKEGVDHTQFSSVVHNFVRQMLLGLKAQAAADEAIASLKRGEKPLIAVENTMGSFLGDYAKDNRLQAGDPLGSFDYRAVLLRALDRSRAIVRQLPNGDKVREEVPLNKLGPETREKYRAAQTLIDSLRIDIPVSPIDWMRHQITQAGFSVAEITGRDLSVDYSDPKRALLDSIDAVEQRDKVRTTRMFNSGELDAVILNVAGSTGISLHASSKFQDQRQRHMIVAQAAQDISIFMQMLGRIHRTGQVALPKYTILNADLPAEKRPTALLSGKMKSLNANTSSNTESATSVKAVDLLNKYGDQVVYQYLEENTELAEALGFAELGDEDHDDIARKATGRLALLPVRVQQQVYADIEEQYTTLLDYLNKTNQNELEPRTFDFDAQERSQAVMFEGQNKASPFGQDAIYGEYSVKAQGKPMLPAEVTALIQEHLGGKTPDQHAQAISAGLDAAYGPWFATQPEAVRATAPLVRVAASRFIEDHPIGSAWRVEINADIYNAVVTNLRTTHKQTGNPFSLSKIQVTVAVNGALRTVTASAPQFNKIEVASLGSRRDGLFASQPDNQREIVKIVTGNLLGGFGELGAGDARGTIISFTKQDGSIEQGILLPKKFNFAKDVPKDYRLHTAADALKFLTESQHENIDRIGITSRDSVVRVLPQRGGITIKVPKSRAKGGRFFLDPALRKAIGDFVSVGNTMQASTADAAQAEQALAIVMKKQALYVTPSMADDARGIVGGEDAQTSRSVAESPPDITGQAFQNIRRGAPANANNTQSISKRAPVDQTAEANALKALSESESLFQRPKSDKTTVEAITDDTAPAIAVRQTGLPNRETMWTLTMPNGRKARITQRVRQADNPYSAEHTPRGFEWNKQLPGENPQDATHKGEIFVDVSNLRGAGAGSRVYNIAATYAHNTGQALIGDPSGLSDQGLIRRPEQMLSSALKFGTTAHLAPHPRQVLGDFRLGVPPLRWVYGDDLGNIRRLISVTLAVQEKAGITAITYDPSDGTFRDSEGAVIDREGIGLLGQAGLYDGGIGAGGTTVMRGAVLRALLREERSGVEGADGRRDGLLAQLLRRVRRGELATKRLFYDPSRLTPAAEPAAETSAQLTWPGAPWGGYEPAVVPRVQAARELQQLIDDRDAGKVDDGAFSMRLKVLADRMAGVTTAKADNRANAERQRGADIVREKLLAARRRGDLDHDTVEFALWALGKNPALADNLGISILAPKNGSPAGDYNPVGEIIRLFKGDGSGDTAVHEILHHAERMMPEDMQAAIRKEWARALATAIKKGTPEQAAALRDVPLAVAGDRAAYGRLVKAIQEGPLNYDAHYQLVNPSEYWAVNGSRILGEQRNAEAGSIWQKIRQFLRELVQKVRAMVGLPSTAAVIRSLHYVTDASHFGVERGGRFESARMLSDPKAAGGALASPSAMKSVAANVVRGRAAMNRALLEKATVHRAMFLPGMGWVDFEWGDNKKGLQHIIKGRREKDGLSDAAIAKLLTQDLVDTIAKGQRLRVQELGGSTNLVIALGGAEAVLVRNAGSNTWLLNGWYKKSGAGANAESYGSNTPTQVGSTPTRPDLGAATLTPGAEATRRDTTESGSPAGAGSAESLPDDPSATLQNIHHTPEQREFIRKSGTGGAPSAREKIRAYFERATKAWSDNWARQFQQGYLDQFTGIKLADKSLFGAMLPDQSNYVAARLANGGTSSVMRALMLHGQAKWADNGQHLEKIPGTKGLLDILAPLGDDVNDFFRWMVAQRANRLMKEGRENNFTQAEINAGMAFGNDAAGNPRADFRTAALAYAAFKRSVLDIGEQAGLINAESRKVWDQADYIPFYREVDEKGTFGATGKKGLSGQSSGIRTLKGGTTALNDPMENILMNFSRLVDASLKNNAIRKTVQSYDVAQSGIVEKIGHAMSSQLIPADQVKQRLADAGTPPGILAVIPDAAFEGMAKMWAIQAPDGPDIVRIMVDGKPQFYKVHDPLLLKALTSFVPFDFPGLSVARAFKRMLTAGITATPEFMARNFIRDSVSVALVGRDGFNPGKSISNILHAYNEGGGSEAMLFAGASFQSGQYNAGDSTGTANAMRRALRRKGLAAGSVNDTLARVLDTPLKFWEKYKHVGEAIENANRLAVFEATRAAGKGATAAAFESKDIMDFSLRGSSPTYQVLADVLPFFNARVQGLYRVGRADPKRLAMYGTLMMAMSVMLAMANSGNDDYDKLEDWDKDAYWHFWIGGEHFTIPKAFEVGAVFGTIPERIVRYIKQQDSGSKAGARIWNAIYEQLAFDLAPQLVRPAINAWANKDTFRGRPIESQRDLGKLPSERFNAFTSPTARTAVQAAAPLADSIGLSPKKLDYLVQGYFGTVGTYVMGLSDIAINAMTSAAPKPERRVDELPVVKSFYRKEPARSTVFESDLYELRNEVDEIYRSVQAQQKLGDEAAVESLVARHEKQLGVRRIVDRAATVLAGLNKARDAVYLDPQMSPKEKRVQLDDIQRQKAELSREVMKDPDVMAAH